MTVNVTCPECWYQDDYELVKSGDAIICGCCGFEFFEDESVGMNKMIALPKFKDYTGQPFRYLQRKMDGHMYHIYKDKVGNVRCVTKNNKDKTDKLMSAAGIRSGIEKLPYATHLMVEVHCPGELATTVAHMIAHSDERLRMAVFACPMLCGIDLSNTCLSIVEDNVKAYGLDFVDTMVYCRGTIKLTEKEIQELLDEALKRGIEGWVLKESHMTGWYKLKPIKTIDAFVTFVTESDSLTYKGHMKALKLGLYHKPLKMVDETFVIHDLGECGGGFSKEFKLSKPYDEMRKSLVGRVCEVEYQSITAHQKLQFPRFIRWRDDKDACDCTTEQLL